MVGQAINLCGSVTALAGSLAFIIVYTLFAPWRTYRIGRLLVTKALFMTGFMVMSILTYVIAPNSGRHIGPLLIVRGALATGYGLMMIYQAYLVTHTQMKGAPKNPGRM